MKHIHADENGTKGIKVSFAALGAIAAFLAIVGVLWRASNDIALKSDLNETNQRVRNLELQMASHFGASPASMPAIDDQPIQAPRFMLAAQMQAQIPQSQSTPRRTVVPIVLIRGFNLEPSRGGTYALLGEDGRYYSLDDVLALLIQLTIRSK